METKKIRLFRGASEIQRLLEAYRHSGQSVKGFCSAHNIAEGTFYNWKHRYIKPSEHRDEKPGFSKLQIVQPVATSLFAEVGSIKIYHPVSAAYLKELQS